MEVVVTFDYAATESDELQIKKGDIISNVSQFEEGWYIGKLNGKEGVFPDNFVKIISYSPDKSKPDAGESLSEKLPAEADSFEKKDEPPEVTGGRASRVLGIGLGNIFNNQPILLKQKSVKDAKFESAEPVSMKPANKGTTGVNNGSATAPTGGSSAASTDRVRVAFDYSPAHTDELELHVNDVVEVFDRDLPEEGWWRGQNLTTNKVGVFPDNFVRPIAAAPKADEDKRNRDRSVNEKAPSALKALVKAPGGGGSSGRLTSERPGSSHGQGNWRTGAIDAPKVPTKPNVSASLTGGEKGKAVGVSPKHGSYEGEMGVTGNDGYASGYPLSSLTADRPRQAGKRPPTRMLASTTGYEQPKSDFNKGSSKFGEHRTGGQPTHPTAYQRSVQGKKTAQLSRGLSAELADVELAEPESGLSELADADADDEHLQAGEDNGYGAAAWQANTPRRRGPAPPNNRAAPPGRSDLVLRGRSVETPVTGSDGDYNSQVMTRLHRQQSQFDQQQQEVSGLKEQVREMQKLFDSLQEANAVIRAEAQQGQKLLADRVHDLTKELDDEKKQRACEVVELRRLTTIVNQLDLCRLSGDGPHSPRSPRPNDQSPSRASGVASLSRVSRSQPPVAAATTGGMGRLGNGGIPQSQSCRR